MTTELGGRHVRLAMPLGAIEEVAAIDDQLGELAARLSSKAWRWSEAAGIVRIGLKHGESGVTLEEVVAERGTTGVVLLALQLLSTSWAGVSATGEPGAAAETAGSA